MKTLSFSFLCLKNEMLFTFTLCRSIGFIIVPWKNSTVVKCRLNKPSNSRSGGFLYSFFVFDFYKLCIIYACNIICSSRGFVSLHSALCKFLIFLYYIFILYFRYFRRSRYLMGMINFQNYKHNEKEKKER